MFVVVSNQKFAYISHFLKSLSFHFLTLSYSLLCLSVYLSICMPVCLSVSLFSLCHTPVYNKAWYTFCFVGVDSIDPNSGSLAGGTKLTIKGKGDE